MSEQISVYDVLNELDDYELIQKNIELLVPGEELATRSLTILKDKYYQVLYYDIVDKAFKTSTEALAYIDKILIDGVDI